MTFGALEENDVIGFPKQPENLINPVAIELTSGPHAIVRANAVLTYMGQLLLKGRGLTREQTVRALQTFPDDWKVFFTEIKTPPDFQSSPDCPRWVPSWWDDQRFGIWVDLKLVKCKVPPSYKSATSPANFHDVIIAFGDQASARMGLSPPYDRIYFYNCFKCPSLNGTVSMDRHLAALLEALSFKDRYRSTAKTVNVLNTVADTSRQTTQVLPPTHRSVNIPLNIVRRGRNRRLRLGGELNPLYDLSAPTSSAQTASSSSTPSAPAAAAAPACPPPPTSGSSSATSSHSPPISPTLPGPYPGSAQSSTRPVSPSSEVPLPSSERESETFNEGNNNNTNRDYNAKKNWPRNFSVIKTTKIT